MLRLARMMDGDAARAAADIGTALLGLAIAAAAVAAMLLMLDLPLGAEALSSFATAARAVSTN